MTGRVRRILVVFVVVVVVVTDCLVGRIDTPAIDFVSVRNRSMHHPLFPSIYADLSLGINLRFIDCNPGDFCETITEYFYYALCW